MIGDPEAVTPPRLRILYRSHGGENAKGRPPYYSKLLSLASVARAVRQARQAGVTAELTYWNDGPVPADRLGLMRATGDVVQATHGSNRRSYRAALRWAARGAWDDADLVWLMEDDYLYEPYAFHRLAQAAAVLPDADYLSMYGRGALDLTGPRRAPRRLDQPAADDAVSVGGATWFRGLSTTSTFGVRLGVLREDLALLRALPFSGGAWDHTTCLTVQGLQPFTWTDVRQELLPFGRLPVAQWPASAARGAVHAGVNLRSRRSPARRRRLYQCSPICIAHLELSDLGDARWDALADEVRAWAVAEGIPVADQR